MASDMEIIKDIMGTVQDVFGDCEKPSIYHKVIDDISKGRILQLLKLIQRRRTVDFWRFH